MFNFIFKLIHLLHELNHIYFEGESGDIWNISIWESGFGSGWASCSLTVKLITLRPIYMALVRSGSSYIWSFLVWMRVPNLERLSSSWNWPVMRLYLTRVWHLETEMSHMRISLSWPLPILNTWRCSPGLSSASRFGLMICTIRFVFFSNVRD